MLSEQDYIEASQILNVGVPEIKAVTEVESSGSGFLNGQVKILFEPHIFWKELKKRGINPYDHLQGNEDILYLEWGAKPYGKYSAQWDRLERAMKINEDAALCSASYGLFQIMGQYFNECGCSNIKDFVSDMQKDEPHQLKAFCSLIKYRHLDDELRNHLWAAFALQYNGKGYKRNKYDTKLQAAYEKYS